MKTKNQLISVSSQANINDLQRLIDDLSTHVTKKNFTQFSNHIKYDLLPLYSLSQLTKILDFLNHINVDINLHSELKFIMFKKLVVVIKKNI